MIRVVVVVVVVVLVVLVAVVAHAAPEDDYQAASRLAGSPGTVPQAIAAFEQLGGARPTSPWTDNAWSEAGRLAERLGELARARHAYEQVLATTEDRALRDRARGALARLGEARWDAVKGDHARWVADSLRGDPSEALDALERLAIAHPTYPDRANLWLAVARGRELEGEPARALELLRAPGSSNAERAKLGFAYVRIAIRGGFLADAERVLEELATAGADRGVIAKLRERLDTAIRRAWIRRGMWLVVLVLGALAAWLLRRETGSWRAAGRRLARPPSEALFLLPIAAVLLAIAFTGNPLVARALLGILAAGVVATWLSGALFESRGRLEPRRAIVQTTLTLVAIGCVTYLSIDRDRLLDLVEETVEHGPSR